MTHSQILKLAARMGESSLPLAETTPGLSRDGLREYWEAYRFRTDLWLMLLAVSRPDESGEPSLIDIIPLCEEICTTGVLTRVTSSLLRVIGEERDIPYAVDIANRSISSLNRCMDAARVAVLYQNHIGSRSLESLNDLGNLCDRLSDVLCSPLARRWDVSDLVADSDRVHDFATTFASRPRLMRLPILQAVRRVPQEPIPHREIADSIRDALLKCFPDIRTGASSLAEEPIAPSAESMPTGQDHIVGFPKIQFRDL